MTAGLRPYPEYKESGLPWLGRIPVHWDVGRNGRLFAQRNQNGFGDLPILEVSLKTGVRVRDMDNLKRKQVMSDREKYKRAAKGDIAYNMMRMWQGAVGVAPEDGLVSPAYVVARPFPGTEPRYFAYQFRTKAYMNEVDGYSRGIVKDRNRLYWQDFKRIPSCMPPYDEQKVIADYLDLNAIRVRRFIRNRRRLIKVLNEQKQVIIKQAVIRGIDPNVRFKPSGIDWLCEIPAHWKIRKLRSLFRLHGSGTTPASDNYYGGDVPWVMSGDLNDGILSTTQRNVTRRAIKEVNALRIYTSGSLIVAMYGATIGKTGILSMDACTNQACCVLADPREEANVWYLQAFVIAARPQLIQQSYGGGQPNINSDIVRSMRVPLPPREEQDKILNSIVRNTRTFFAVICQTQREIDLIQEYRARLISDVVTGKLDVRHLSPVLGEETAELADLDEEMDIEDLSADEKSEEPPEMDDSGEAEE